MEGFSAGVSKYTRDGKTGDVSIPLIGVTVWEFIRELATIAVETVLNHVGNKKKEYLFERKCRVRIHELKEPKKCFIYLYLACVTSSDLFESEINFLCGQTVGVALIDNLRISLPPDTQPGE